MFCARFFNVRMFAMRFFCKVGASSTFNPAWAANANRTIGLLIEPQ